MSYKKRACRSGIYSANLVPGLHCSRFKKRSYGFLPPGSGLLLFTKPAELFLQLNDFTHNDNGGRF
jgi:hypothetical protein